MADIAEEKEVKILKPSSLSPNDIAYQFTSKIDHIVNVFKEEIRVLLRNLTNGDLDADLIAEVGLECKQLLNSLPESSEGLRNWAEKFSKTVHKVRCHNGNGHSVSI